MPNEPLNRLSFWTVFSPSVDGSIRLDHDLIVNGARFPTGSIINPGQFMAGIDIIKRKGTDLAVANSVDGAYILRGFYLPDGQQ